MEFENVKVKINDLDEETIQRLFDNIDHKLKLGELQEANDIIFFIVKLTLKDSIRYEHNNAKIITWLTENYKTANVDVATLCITLISLYFNIYPNHFEITKELIQFIADNSSLANHLFFIKCLIRMLHNLILVHKEILATISIETIMSHKARIHTRSQRQAKQLLSASEFLTTLLNEEIEYCITMKDPYYALAQQLENRVDEEDDWVSVASDEDDALGNDIDIASCDIYKTNVNLFQI